MKPGWKNFLAVVVLLVLGMAVYLNTFGNRFVYDDLVTVEENVFIRDPGNLQKLFSQDYYLLSEEYSFRPLVTVTCFWDYSRWGINPWGYHLTNLLLHLASGLAVYFLASRLLRTVPAAFLAGLIFLLHPVQTEAVAAISFREDLLCALFFCLALIFYLKEKPLFYFLSLLGFILAPRRPGALWRFPFPLRSTGSGGRGGTRGNIDCIQHLRHGVRPFTSGLTVRPRQGRKAKPVPCGVQCSTRYT